MVYRVFGSLSESTARQDYLSGPQVELFEGRQLDELLSAGTGDISEGQTQVLQVPKGARAQQTSKISILYKEQNSQTLHEQECSF